MIDKYKDYCFIELYAVNRFEFYRHYYVNLYLKMDDDLKDYIIYFIVLFTLILFISIFVYFCFYSSKHLIKIYVNSFARRNIHISYFLSSSCLFFYFFYGFSLIHCIYKSILLVDLAYLLSGYKIIYFHTNEKKKIIKIILIIFIEILVTLLCIYISYFATSFDGFYIFFGKILIDIQLY